MNTTPVTATAKEMKFVDVQILTGVKVELTREEAESLVKFLNWGVSTAAWQRLYRSFVFNGDAPPYTSVTALQSRLANLLSQFPAEKGSAWTGSKF